MKNPANVRAGKKSKRRGGKFELDMVKFLREQFPDHEFAKCSSLPEAHKMSAMAGDIASDLNCTFECKNVDSLPFHQIIQGKCSALDKWIQQTIDEAPNTDDAMVLFFKANLVGTYFAYSPPEGPKKEIPEAHGFTVYNHSSGLRWLIMPLEHFGQYIRDDLIEENKNE